jgi:hypothetical protein
MCRQHPMKNRSIIRKAPPDFNQGKRPRSQGKFLTKVGPFMEIASNVVYSMQSILLIMSFCSCRESGEDQDPRLSGFLDALENGALNGLGRPRERGPMPSEKPGKYIVYRKLCYKKNLCLRLIHRVKYRLQSDLLTVYNSRTDQEECVQYAIGGGTRYRVVAVRTEPPRPSS